MTKIMCRILLNKFKTFLATTTAGKALLAFLRNCIKLRLMLLKKHRPLNNELSSQYFTIPSELLLPFSETLLSQRTRQVSWEVKFTRAQS